MSEHRVRGATRQAREAAVYDERASTLEDQDLHLDPLHPPYPNREHVDFLNFLFARLGDPYGQRVLEVGCGSGTLSTYLALRGAEVVGVDVSTGMLALARRRAETNGVSAHITWVHSGIEEFDDKPGSFDAVFANQVLHHLDLPRAMPKISELIGERGTALFVEPVLLVPEWVRTFRYSRSVTRVFPARTDTPDERSIDMSALALIRSAFRTSTITPFQLTTRLQNFIELSDRTFERLERFDRAVLAHVPLAQRLARYIVLAMDNRTTTKEGRPWNAP
jgi:2-polyprenyl-3-methyl-5-hydroxy-6-metoxy-1,4-benzoquinol methylase